MTLETTKGCFISFFFQQYTAVDQKCAYTKAGNASTVSGYAFDRLSTMTTAGNEKLMQKYVATIGPLAVCLYVSSKFQAYTSG